MNKETILTIGKSIVIILILLAVVFALKAPAAELHFFNDDMKPEYIDSSGLPYFSEMDSYYNLRLTENYVSSGSFGDEVINGSDWDMHRLAPDGNEIHYEGAIVYVTSWLHGMANSVFGGNYSVKEVAFWTGAIISTLAVIPAFIFSRRITNDYGAIVATLLIVLAPNYFAHTFPGFFDTDMFYYIFPLFFIFFFIEALRTDNMVYKLIFAVLSILSIGLFSQSWNGYIFYIGMMGAFSVVYLIAGYFFNIGDDRDSYSSKIQWLTHNKDLITILILAVIGFVGLVIFKGVDGVLSIFGSLTGLLNLQSASVVVGGFPNVLISVAEMQAPALVASGMVSAFLASTNGVINGIGGITILFAGLIVLYVLVSRAFKFRSKSSTKNTSSKKPQKGERKSAAKKIDDDRKFKFALTDLKFGGNNDILADKRLTVMYATLFVVWIVVSAVAVSRGSRFITTIVLPFGLLAGIFVSYAGDYVKNRLNNDKWMIAILFLCGFLASVPLATINVIYGIALFLVIIVAGLFTIYALKPKASVKIPPKKYIIIIAIVIALVSPTVCSAYLTSNNVVPGTSDAMWNSMQWINETQSEDTVITSWWDFGYLFEIAGDKQTTFDGGSQTGGRAFWLGKAMSTDNLELSAGIFRMLDTTGDRAVEKLVNITGDTGKSVDILIDILPKSSSDAEKTLVDTYKLSSDDAGEVVKLTHPDNPRPVIFVASSDMLGKAGWWSYFGGWNFENQSSKNFNYYSPTSQVTVEPGSSGKLQLHHEQVMDINAVIERGNENNTTTAQAECVYADNGEPIKVNGSDYNPMKASHLIVIEDGYLMKNESIEGAEDGNFTMFLIGNENQYSPFLISNELANSMFTRLYLLGGAGQDIFTNVHTEPGVMLFKVNFDKTAAGGSSGSSSNK